MTTTKELAQKLIDVTSDNWSNADIIIGKEIAKEYLKSIEREDRLKAQLEKCREQRDFLARHYNEEEENSATIIKNCEKQLEEIK